MSDCHCRRSRFAPPPGLGRLPAPSRGPNKAIVHPPPPGNRIRFHASPVGECHGLERNASLRWVASRTEGGGNRWGLARVAKEDLLVPATVKDILSCSLSGVWGLSGLVWAFLGHLWGPRSGLGLAWGLSASLWGLSAASLGPSSRASVVFFSGRPGRPDLQAPGGIDGRFGLLAACNTGCTNVCRTCRSPGAEFDESRCNRGVPAKAQLLFLQSTSCAPPHPKASGISPYLAGDRQVRASVTSKSKTKITHDLLEQTWPTLAGTWPRSAKLGRKH